MLKAAEKLRPGSPSHMEALAHVAAKVLGVTQARVGSETRQEAWLCGNVDGVTLMQIVRKKRLRFFVIWMAVFGAVFAWWLFQGALEDGPVGRTLVWLNMPSLAVALVVSGNAHQPSFVGWAVAYFVQWSVIGYFVAWLIYRNRTSARQ